MKRAQKAQQAITVGQVGWAGPSAAAVSEKPGEIRHWIECGRRVNVWTINDRESLEQVCALGVYAVPTDRPAEILELLETAP